MGGGSADIFVEYLAANVRAARRRMGLSQDQLAEAVGVETSYIRRIEAAGANPTLKVLLAVARALDVQPGRLFRKTKAQARTPGRPRKRSTRGT